MTNVAKFLFDKTVERVPNDPRQEFIFDCCDCPPPDFNAGMYPILARHWFGIAPDSQTANFHPAEVSAGLRRQRQIEHVHQLGARAVGELLYEVAEGGDLDRALDAYERLTPSLLKAMGADRFPPSPLHAIPSS